MEATTITKHILDFSINLTVDELLASIPAIEKQLIKAISKDKTIQFQVNILEFGKTVEIKKPHS